MLNEINDRPIAATIGRVNFRKPCVKKTEETDTNIYTTYH